MPGPDLALLINGDWERGGVILEELGVFIFLEGRGRGLRECVLLIAFFLLYLGRWMQGMMRETNALGNAVGSVKV